MPREKKKGKKKKDHIKFDEYSQLKLHPKIKRMDIIIHLGEDSTSDFLRRAKWILNKRDKKKKAKAVAAAGASRIPRVL